MRVETASTGMPAIGRRFDGFVAKAAVLSVGFSAAHLNLNPGCTFTASEYVTVLDPLKTRLGT
jgi:hypothetical protein